MNTNHPIPERWLPLQYPVPGSCFVQTAPIPKGPAEGMQVAVINPIFDSDLRRSCGHLFAAAPDLLSALREVVDLAQSTLDSDVEKFGLAIARAELAITKAEGRAA